MPTSRPTLCAATLALLLPVACGAPEDADVAPSDYVLASPSPTLLPNVTFAQAVADARPARARIEAETAALEARAAALRARADALGTPLIDPATRDRLEPPASN